MTTGRINQVTILTAGTPGPRTGVPPGPPLESGGRELVTQSERRPKPSARTRDHAPGPKPPGNLWLIQLPPMSSPRDGPRQSWGVRGLEAGPITATYAPRMEDTSRPSRPEDGYGLRLTPECLWIMIAIGQPSTDSFRAHERKPMGLRDTLVRPRGALEIQDL